MKSRMKLKQLMIDQEITKAELARRTGMQAGTIGWIISGRFIPYESQLAKIADALGWEGDPEELLKEVE